MTYEDQKKQLIELLKAADACASEKMITDYDDAIADNADFLMAHGAFISEKATVAEKKEILKPCPFCGHTGELRHSDLYLHSGNCSESIRGLYSAEWTATCSYCGAGKFSRRSYYGFTRAGELVLAEREPDGRAEVIELWNRRAEP